MKLVRIFAREGGIDRDGSAYPERSILIRYQVLIGYAVKPPLPTLANGLPCVVGQGVRDDDRPSGCLRVLSGPGKRRWGLWLGLAGFEVPA